MFDVDHECYMDAFKKYRSDLQRTGKNTITYTAINLDKREIIAHLSSGLFSTCVFFGVGGGGDCKQYFSPEIETYLKCWVSAGGNFIVLGEGNGKRKISVILQEWFQKPWKYTDYYRCWHILNKSCELSMASAHGISFPKRYNVKSCMLSNVPPHETLFFEPSTDDEDFDETEGNPKKWKEGYGGPCPVAVTTYGRGRLSFIGDVNAELETIQIIHLIGSLPGTEENWLRRRNFITALYPLDKLASLSPPSASTTDAAANVKVALRVLSQIELVKIICTFI
jgi:hypothetical protein